jgi:hypothetical protein
MPLGPGIAIRLADVVPNPSHLASITGPKHLGERREDLGARY